jgi:hypothetical protein
MLWQVPEAASDWFSRTVARYFGAKWGQVDFSTPGMVFGDSDYQVYHWVEKRATDRRNVAEGVRVMLVPDSWYLDFTRDGHFVRGVLKLEDGGTVEIGRAGNRWPSLENNLPTAAPRTLPWRQLGGDTAGQRYMLGGRRGWIDTAGTGPEEHVVRDTEDNGNVVSYLGDSKPRYMPGGVPRAEPSRAESSRAGRSGAEGSGAGRSGAEETRAEAGRPRFQESGQETTITRDTKARIVGRRDRFPGAGGDVMVTGTGGVTPWKTWTWTARRAGGGDDGGDQGLRLSNRNELWEGGWDDSFRDYHADSAGTQTLLRDVHSLSKGSALFAWSDSQGRWHSEIRGPGGTPKAGSAARRQWRVGESWEQSPPRGTQRVDWRDLDPEDPARILRELADGRVREYPSGRGVHEPSGIGEWREYAHGEVFRERRQTGEPGIFRETENFWKQWRETTADGGLLRTRDIAGKVWERSPIGPWKLMAGTWAPSVGRWEQVGRGYEYRGLINDLRTKNRVWTESNRWQYATVDGLAGTFIPRATAVAAKTGIQFTGTFVADALARVAAEAAVYRRLHPQDTQRILVGALLTTAVKAANNLLHDVQSPIFLKALRDGLANVDAGRYQSRWPFHHDKHGDNEYSGPETPPRWRIILYDYLESTVAAGGLGAFVETAVIAHTVGFPAQHYEPLTGRHATTAAAAAMANHLALAISLGLISSLSFQIFSGRLYHRGGPAELLLAFSFLVLERAISQVALRGELWKFLGPVD